MAAPNKQPCGSRPGPAAPHEHGPVKGAANGQGQTTPMKGAGVAGHGAPKPVGNKKSNPLK